MATFKARLVKPIDVVENFDGTFSSVVKENIDTDNRIIKNVCVMGTPKSKNGRTYTENAMGKITTLTEGTKCFINHPSKTELKDRDGVRDLKDWVGVFRGARREGAKILSNLHVRESYFDLVRDIATMQPAQVGNSINARVKIFTGDDGKESVADVDMLRSVDLVANAATTQSLFESAIDKNFDPELEIIIASYEGVLEGLLKDQIDNEKLQREISDLIWSAGELARDVIRKSEIDSVDKKDKIKGIYADLSTEIDRKLGKTKTSSSKEGEQNKDGGNKRMDINTLKSEHPELLAAIEKSAVDQFKKDQDIETTKSRMDELQATLDELKSLKEEIEKEKTELQKTIDSLNSENKDLKAELDEIKTAEKGAAKKAKVQEMITESKLPKDAISEVFVETLMALEEDEVDGTVVTFEEQAKLMLDDRKKVWNLGSSKVKGCGDEFVEESDKGKKTVTDTDVDDFASKKKRR